MPPVSEQPDNKFTIEPTGRVIIDERAQSRLAALPGDYRVLPSSGDLIVLQRISAGPGAEAKGKVNLCGSVENQGALIDVIHYIHTNAWTGQLAVVSGLTRKTIYFFRGDVRSAASNDPADRLGAILFRFGVIDEQTLNDALASGAGRLGQTLIQKGAISPHDLYTYIRKQVEEIFFSLLAVNEGEFYFYRTKEEDGPASQLQLSTQSLLFDGVRRLDEMALFRVKLPSADYILCPHKNPSGKLPDDVMAVYNLIDGVRDLQAVSRLTRLGEFETMKIVHHLMQSGFVQARPPKSEAERIADEPSSSNPASSADSATKIIELFNEFYAKVVGAVLSKGSARMLYEGLKSFFESTDDYAPLFANVVVQPDGTLPVSQIRANLDQAPVSDRLSYLHRGLNELLFFLLFTAGESVDQKEEAALNQRLVQLLGKS